MDMFVVNLMVSIRLMVMRVETVLKTVADMFIVDLLKLYYKLFRICLSWNCVM
ncbi:hypothetical protein HanHA300_Chr10g0357141 [Helianthus annuus]|nr:hypothetical protein HanHA300_Chr10g0357141 [Helianthus annuus]